MSIRKIGVIGAGQMGNGIAHVAAACGLDVVLNDGLEPLEPGDVVVITGAADPVLGEIPVIKVKKAGTANSTAVMGVVDRKFVAAQAGAQSDDATPAGHFFKASLMDVSNPSR